MDSNREHCPTNPRPSIAELGVTCVDVVQKKKEKVKNEDTVSCNVAWLHVRSEVAIRINTEEMQNILQEGNKQPAIEGEEAASIKKIRVAEVHGTGEVESVAVEREGGSAIVERQGEIEMVEKEGEEIAVRGGQGESEMVEEEEDIVVGGEIGAVGGEIGVVGGDKEVQEVETVMQSPRHLP